MIVIQLMLYCALFTWRVKLGVGTSPLNGLFFYPRAYQERAFALGLTRREAVARRRGRFMPAFFLVMLAALLLIIGLWNGVRTFGPAYGQALLFLEVMNAFDGVVIDRLWVGHSRVWVIPAMRGVPFVQSWAQVLKKRAVLALVWIAGAAIVAGLVVLIF